MKAEAEKRTDRIDEAVVPAVIPDVMEHVLQNKSSPWVESVCKVFTATLLSCSCEACCHVPVASNHNHAVAVHLLQF